MNIKEAHAILKAYNMADGLTEPPDSIKIKSIKCPVCKRRGQVRKLLEIYSRSIAFMVVKNRRETCGTKDSGGAITSVEAECVCGNRWRLRGIRQLTDLDLE